MPYRRISQSLLAAVLCLAVAHPLCAPRAASAEQSIIAQLSESIQKERERIGALNTRAEETFGAIEDQVLDRMEQRRQELQEQVDQWRSDLEFETIPYVQEVFVEVDDLRAAIDEAEEIGRAGGLDVDQLRKLYEQTKKIIRRTDFVIPGKPDYDKDEKLTSRFLLLFSFAHDYEEAIAEARHKHQKFKVGLYKKAALAYLDALLSAKEPPGACDPVTIRATTTANVDGVETPVYGCPDPVVDKMRAYLDAVLSIAGAEADALAAEATMTLAQQQLTTDTMGLVPLVGDALDFYTIVSGEDLAGNTYPPWIRKAMALLVLLPAVNSSTAHKIVDQITARSKAAAVAFESLNEYFAFLADKADDAWYAYKYGSQNAAETALRQGAAKQFGTSVDALDELMETLPRQLDEVRRVDDDAMARMRDWQRMRDSVESQGSVARTGAGGVDEASRIDYGDAMARMRNWQRIKDSLESHMDVQDFRRLVPEEMQQKVLNRAERNVREGILDMQGTMAHAVNRSNIHKDHIGAFQRVARDRGEVILTRPVNPKVKEAMGNYFASTKHMGIKSKSAAEGPIAALIPVNQSLNKQGSQLQELMQARRAASSADEIAELQAKIQKVKRDLKKGAAEMDKCLSKPDDCAQAVVFKVDNPAGEGMADLLMVKDKATGRQVYGVEGPGGRLLDPDTGEVLNITPVGAPQKVEVLADQQGRYITADYDLLGVAKRNADYEPAGWHPTMGGVTEGQVQTVTSVNKHADYVAGNVAHHGPETGFAGSKGVDYPITAFAPDGSVVTIPACDAACMVEWCRRNSNRCVGGAAAPDPDRLLKDYFYYMKLMGYNMDPNPNWGWGPFNMFAGYAARVP